MQNLDPRFVADHIRHDLRPLWEMRALFVLRFQPDCPIDPARMVAVLIAALGPASILGKLPPGRIRPRAWGDNAKITKEGKIISKLVLAGKDVGEREVCSVDDMRRTLAWMLTAMQATDAEWTEVFNKINAWIVRDENQIALHVERMRDTALPGGAT